MGSDRARRVEQALGTGVTGVERLDGGMIGEVIRCDLTDGRVVVAKTAEHDLRTERRMLSSLAEHAELPVPTVLHVDADRLCLEYVAGESLITPAVERACVDFGSLLIEPDHPALLHGDVWRTNLLTNGERVTAFLDPACSYGHPEIELADADWTETVGDAFFERYQAECGIDLGDGFWDRRRYVYRLYPLLVHVRLFGGEHHVELAETLDLLGYRA